MFDNSYSLLTWLVWWLIIGFIGFWPARHTWTLYVGDRCSPITLKVLLTAIFMSVSGPVMFLVAVVSYTLYVAEKTSILDIVILNPCNWFKKDNG